MKNIFFFGTGFCAEIFVNKVKRSLKILGDFHVSGFLDNNRNKIGTTFEGYPVYSPDILREYPCDLVLLFYLRSTIMKMYIDNWLLFCRQE